MDDDLREVETLGRRLLLEKLNLGQCRMFEIPRAIDALLSLSLYVSNFSFIGFCFIFHAFFFQTFLVACYF